MQKVIYQHKDSEAMTRELLEWITDPASQECDSLKLMANCDLEAEASRALVHSSLGQKITSLEFSEIYFLPQQLAELLSMPSLTEMRIWGGESYDYAGPKYIYDTLNTEHIDIFMFDPNAQRLRELHFSNQGFSEILGSRLRQALPNLTVLRIEGEDY